MKNLILFTAFLISGIFSTVSAQYYTNYNTTYKTSSPKSYSTSQTYTTPKSYSTVNTYRTYNSSGGYSSSTTSFGSKGLKSTSQTTYNPYVGYTTVKHNYNTNKTTYKYSSPRLKTYKGRR